MDTLLSTIDYDVKSPSAYSRLNSLYREARKRGLNMSRSQVKKWLTKHYVYNIHRPMRRKFARNKVYAAGINDQFQIDLADMQVLAAQNKEFNYIFTCICVFSKYAWAIPVQSDEGMELRSNEDQTLLKQHDIHLFTSKNREIKAAIIERFNRTLKTKLWKHFSTTGSYKYIDAPQDVVYRYNHSHHRSIKMVSFEVNEGNEAHVRERLYRSKAVAAKFKFKVGDIVRVSKIMGTFANGYLPNWSE